MVSTEGMSTPSLKMSTVKMTLIWRAANRDNASARSADPGPLVTARDGIPASLKTRAMYSACKIATQKPSARIE